MAFTFTARWVEFTLIGLIAILIILSGYPKTAGKLLAFFLILVAIQYLVIPHLPTILGVLFTILTVYARKIFPCIMMGGYIIASTPVRLLMNALEKLHMPKEIVIPLAITFRYFPAIGEEYRHIRDALKLRNIHGILKRLECTVVPVLVSAVQTADELSAAAITRGIENPGEKTCAVTLKFHMVDAVCILLALAMIALGIIAP